MSETSASGARGLLELGSIRLDAKAENADEAIRIAGQRLVEIGAVDPSYVNAMLERERSVSTYMGEGVAIPHGTDESKGAVRRNALSFTRFPAGVDWNGQPVTVAIGIAALDSEHVSVLSTLAMILADPTRAKELREAGDRERVLALLTPELEGDATAV